MTVLRRVGHTGRLLKLAAAALIGFSLRTFLPPDPVAVPGIGPVPAFLAGGLGLALGVVLFDQPWRQESDCGCGDDCGC